MIYLQASKSVSFHFIVSSSRPDVVWAGTLFLSMLGGSEFRLRFCGSAAPRSAGPAAQTLSGREPFLNSKARCVLHRALSV